MIPSADWAWADCDETAFPGKPDQSKICVRGGFRSDLLYQLQYKGRDPLVLGLGLAAVRDVVSFFRFAQKDKQGTANPIAGEIKAVIGLGISQSGNFVRTFLNLGFNEDEEGRRVWDGAMPIIAARQTPINLRFAVPGRASNLYEPGSDGTVWWTGYRDDVYGKATRIARPLQRHQHLSQGNGSDGIVRVLRFGELPPTTLEHLEPVTYRCLPTCAAIMSPARNMAVARAVFTGNLLSRCGNRLRVRLRVNRVFCRPIQTRCLKSFERCSIVCTAGYHGNEEPPASIYPNSLITR